MSGEGRQWDAAALLGGIESFEAEKLAMEIEQGLASFILYRR
jgi:hypothetical protein